MKILVMEDEKRIADNLKKGLEFEKYSVDISYNGLEGYDLASTGDYDLLVLDLMLPGLDGLTITKKLRESGSNLPILILTAKGQVQDKVAGLNSGADDYLTKPFSFEELVSRVRALLRRPNVIAKEILKSGDLSLNKNTFQVTRFGKDITLSHHEFALLSFLLSRKNSIVNKDQIISHVWNFDADVLPNTVEATIKNLRSKIEKPFPGSEKIIITHRGLGYKIK
jgi:DNA-binding response OmpR family regulator